MKSLPLSQNGPAPARHEDRASRSRRTFPRTDYHFHAPAEDAVAVREQHTTTSRDDLRAFRQLSQEYLGEKKHLGYLADLVVFALVAGLVSWPLVTLVILLVQTANG